MRRLFDNPAGSRGPAAAAGAPLTEPGFWDERHLRASSGPLRPRPGRRHLDFELVRFLDRHLRDKPPGRFLEIGCGGSIWMPHVARRYGWSVAGLDYSEAGQAACRRHLAAAAVEAELVRADLLDPAFRPPGRYDAVFSLGFLEHFSDVEEMIARVAACLRPGGLYLAWIPNATGAAERISRRLDAGAGRRARILGLDDWCAAHRRAGLVLREAYAGQFLDFSHVSLLGFPPAVRKSAGLAVRGLSWPFLALERGLDVRVGLKPLCSGLFLAAQAPRGPSREA